MTVTTDLQRALRSAAWKLTLRRVAFSALVAVGAGAGLWCVAVVMVGASPRVFAALAIAAGVALVASFFRARATVLEAARRVEQAAGWQERLSTAVELEAAGDDNAFRARLAAEIETLLRRHSPAGLIAWDLQRPAVIAAALVVAAVAVTAMFPRGFGMTRAHNEMSPDRRLAADALEDALARAARGPQAARLGDLRAELVGILNDIRANRPLSDVRSRLDRAISNVEARLADNVTGDASAVAGAMRNSPALAEIADAIRRLDASGVREAGQNLASRLTSISEAERQGVSSSLTSSAEAAKSPGWSSPLWEMKRAADERREDTFRTFSSMLAGVVGQEQSRTGHDFAGLDHVRGALVDARSALGGGSDERERRADFFAEANGTGDNATGAEAGSGNLTVRGGADDIKAIYEGAKAADAVVPQLPAVIEDARTAAETGAVGPAYREYIRRYFAPDNSTR